MSEFGLGIAEYFFNNEFSVIGHIFEHLDLPARMTGQAGGHKSLPDTHQTGISLLKIMSSFTNHFMKIGLVMKSLALWQIEHCENFLM
jgi:hypothetical protein